LKITEAPTKEIAIGMKISDLAMLPQLIRSVSCAARSPKAVDAAGTTRSQSMLLRMASQNFASDIICW
jgi:hypothetical protein